MARDWPTQLRLPSENGVAAAIASSLASSLASSHREGMNSSGSYKYFSFRQSRKLEHVTGLPFGMKKNLECPSLFEHYIFADGM